MNTIIWTKKELSIISAVFFGSIVISALLIKLLKPEINYAALLMDSLLCVSIISIICFYLKNKGAAWNEYGLKEVNLKYFALSFLAIFFIAIVGGFLSSTLSDLLGLESQAEDMKKYFEGVNKLFAILSFKISASLLAPIAEELFFRGIIFKFFRQRKTFIFSALSSSLLFSLMHFDIAMLPFTFILGFATAYMLEKTQNIFYPILIHGAVNNLAVNMMLMGIL